MKDGGDSLTGKAVAAASVTGSSPVRPQCPNCGAEGYKGRLCYYCWWEPGEKLYKPWWMPMNVWQEGMETKWAKQNTSK